MRDLGSSWCWCWCAKLGVHPWVFQSRISANYVHRIFEIAKLRHLGSSHRNFHLPLPLDQRSLGMRWLQLLCPGSYSPILCFQVKMSWQMCCTFVRNLRAFQHHSSHRSRRPNSSRRSIRQDSIRHEYTTSQWYKPSPFALIPEFPSLFLISSFQDLRYPYSMFVAWAFGTLDSTCGSFLDFPLDVPLFSLLLPLLENQGSLLDHNLPCLPLPYECLLVLLRALHSRWKCAPPHWEHPSGGLDDPFPLAEERESWLHQHPWDPSVHANPVSLGLESRILKPKFASTYVTISRRASSKVRRRLELRIRCFSSSSGTSLKARQLDLVVHRILQLLLATAAQRTPMGSIPASLEFQKRAIVQPSNDRAMKFAHPSSCMHLRQHELQVLYSSLLVRRSRQEFTIDELCRELRRLFSGPLQHHFGFLDHSSEEYLSLLRPLLEILFLTREFLSDVQGLSHRWDSECLSELGLWQDCWLLVLRLQVQIAQLLELWVQMALVEVVWQLAPS